MKLLAVAICTAAATAALFQSPDFNKGIPPFSVSFSLERTAPAAPIVSLVAAKIDDLDRVRDLIDEMTREAEGADSLSVDLSDRLTLLVKHELKPALTQACPANPAERAKFAADEQLSCTRLDIAIATHKDHLTRLVAAINKVSPEERL